MLSFLGMYVRGRRTAVYSGSVITVFERVGVSEDAVRSTLARMVKRNLLLRHRRGRIAYFGLTERAEEILADGYRRIWETGAVNRDWNGMWTLVGFSLPDSWRGQRHDLRSALIWAGFGLLHSGLWISPGEKDVGEIVAGLGLRAHLTVFHARSANPTDAADLVRRAFDTSAIATRYRTFLGRWDRRNPVPDAPDDLARQLLLHADWLRLVRQDPHLPAEQLPRDWPAIRAEKLFHTLAARYEPTAARLAESILDVIPAPSPTADQRSAGSGGTGPDAPAPSKSS